MTSVADDPRDLRDTDVDDAERVRRLTRGLGNRTHALRAGSLASITR